MISTNEREVNVKKVRALREAEGWSQSELARRAGLHSTTVSVIESGRWKPGLGQIEKLAAALGVDTVDLEDVSSDASD